MGSIHLHSTLSTTWGDHNDPGPSPSMCVCVVCAVCLSNFLSYTHKHTMWRGGDTNLSVLNYLPLNLANMQVICGVATSQLSRLLSAAPNPQLATTFPSNMLAPPPPRHPHPSCRDFYCFISMLHVTWRPLREPSNHNAFWQMST